VSAFKGRHVIRHAYTEVDAVRGPALYNAGPRYRWTLRYVSGWVAARGSSRTRLGGHVAAFKARLA
jgi:hypothetical protein